MSRHALRRATAATLALVLPLAVLVVAGAGSAAAAAGWSSTGSMTDARYFHTATRLSDGTVLVTGGSGSDRDAVSSAEVYDPDTETWSPTGSMATARFIHTATRLSDGTVLVAGGAEGGFGSAVTTATAEIYDPDTGTWTPTGSMATARYVHTATALPDGTVLVTGGDNGVDGTVSSAEVYDPDTGTWTPTGSMINARNSHTATPLPDGTVLVAGGSYELVLASAEVYDPDTGTWTPTGSMATARQTHTATTLPDGKVLVTGGLGDAEATALAELYDADTGTWTPTGSLTTTRFAHTATTLPDGTLLVAGGSELTASTELYEPDTGTWSTTGSLATNRLASTATTLSDGTVLVAGGSNEAGLLASAEVYELAVPGPDTDGDGRVDATDNCPAVANRHQSDTDRDRQGDRCEPRHARSLTLSATHVMANGEKRLQLRGSLSVADKVKRCTTNRQVLYGRYRTRTSTWVRVATSTTRGNGRFTQRVPHVTGKYRVRVRAQKVSFDGLTTVCAPTSTTKRHTH